MSNVRILHGHTSYGPEQLKELGELFDAVWASVALDFVEDGEGKEAVRARLATIVLDLAKDGQLDAMQITRTAGRLIGQEHRGEIAGVNRGPARGRPD
jgi:hypothetical protein